MAERTHDPTAKRLREAREKGDVPRAPLLAGAVGLLAASALIPSLLAALTQRMARTLQNLAPVDRVDPWSVAMPVISLVAPIASTLIALALIAAIVQGSLSFSPSRVAPDPSRLDPFGGLKNLFDKSRLWNAFRGLLVAVAIVLVVSRLVVVAGSLATRAIASPASVLGIAAEFGRKVAVTAGAIACGIAVLDVVIARRIWLGKLRMTRDEVVREHKEGEGDPDIKRRREELHHELLAGEAIAAVRDATVVVINPTHLACALRYEKGDEDAAPTLVTKGEGALAARILEAARVYGVPVIRDVPVARALYELELGTEIPEALYEAVAEVLRAAWDGE